MPRRCTIPADAVLAPGVAYTVQRTVPTGPWAFPDHDHHGYCELTFVDAGSVLSRDPSGERRLGPGALILVRERDVHALDAGPGMRLLNLVMPASEWRRLVDYLDGDWLVRGLVEAPTPPWVVLGGPERERCADGLRALERSAGRPDARRRLAEFLLGWLPALAAAGAAHPRPAWFEDLLARMDGIIDAGGLTPGRMARRAGVAPAHLARTFRIHLGCTPSAYLNRRRLAVAADLLASTRRTVGDVAETAGFASRSHFHRAFRAVYGASPRSYRRTGRTGISR